MNRTCIGSQQCHALSNKPMTMVQLSPGLVCISLLCVFVMQIPVPVWHSRDSRVCLCSHWTHRKPNGTVKITLRSTANKSGKSDTHCFEFTHTLSSSLR